MMKVLNQESGNSWTIYNGDTCEIIKGIPDRSIHYSIFSPSFINLYTYSNSERDMGNCRSEGEFFENFKYFVPELFRVMMAGRLVSIHCMDVPAMKERDGYIGLKDFPGELIRVFESAGFIYHSRVVIWKDPLTEATRTKALGLMHKQIEKDSAMCRQGLPDYLITMRKPGLNDEPIAHRGGFDMFVGENEPAAPKQSPTLKSQNAIEDHHSKIQDKDPVYSHQVWRRYASPVWMDINQSNTLQRESAREERDEKHICPLQLDVISRAIHLWTNEGDIVFDPFDGIGSTGVCALKLKRRHIGIELKASYWQQGIKNCRAAEQVVEMPTLFDLLKE